MSDADEAKPGTGPVVWFLIGPDTSWDRHTCERFQAVLDSADHGVVICDVNAVGLPNLGTIDFLARLRLTARRSGWHVLLHGAHSELRALLTFAGLAAVLPLTPDSPFAPEQPPTQEK